MQKNVRKLHFLRKKSGSGQITSGPTVGTLLGHILRKKAQRKQNF